MISANKIIVSELNKILPTYYELVLSNSIKTPCISYQERNNAIVAQGETIDYSNLAYTIKVWDNDLAQIESYAKSIDKTMKKLGFTRTNSGELHDNQSDMIQKIMEYQALTFEMEVL